ncbi:MAG: hypothetical protein U9N46_13585 [Euryarchaeota archaeon]|nr:hypothetical protein [Euryarchaeota archaeon]
MKRRLTTTEIRILLRTILSAGVLVLLLAGTAAGATTWVVDGDGGADRMGMQVAEAAA